jgi:hypothetical protein
MRRGGCEHLLSIIRVAEIGSHSGGWWGVGGWEIHRNHTFEGDGSIDLVDVTEAFIWEAFIWEAFVWVAFVWVAFVWVGRWVCFGDGRHGKEVTWK